MPNTLTLTTLTCGTTEDWLGPDEVKLEVFVDGSPSRVETRTMNDGAVWPLNLSFQFNSTVEIKVWDEDSPDADDLLGSHTLTKTSLPVGALAFTEDEAMYTLTYVLVVTPDLPTGTVPGTGTLPGAGTVPPTGGIVPGTGMPPAATPGVPAGVPAGYGPVTVQQVTAGDGAAMAAALAGLTAMLSGILSTLTTISSTLSVLATGTRGATGAAGGATDTILS